MTRTAPKSSSKWHLMAEQSRADAATMPEGSERDRLFRLARDLDRVAQMNGWLTSPRLEPK
jgi:hypothetical protein